MTPFDCNYQNPSRFAFLRIISDIVIFTPLGLQNLNNKKLNSNLGLTITNTKLF